MLGNALHVVQVTETITGLQWLIYTTEKLLSCDREFLHTMKPEKDYKGMDRGFWCNDIELPSGMMLKNVHFDKKNKTVKAMSI